MVVVPFRSAAFYSQLKSKVGYILAKSTNLLINLNKGGAPIAASHTHTLTLPVTNLSSHIHFPLLRPPIPPFHIVCAMLSVPPALALSLSLPTLLFIYSP